MRGITFVCSRRKLQNAHVSMTSALPLLWHDRIIGWANAHLRPAGYGGQASISGSALKVDVGYVDGQPPRDRGFRRALAAERAALAAFLGADD